MFYGLSCYTDIKNLHSTQLSFYVTMVKLVKLISFHMADNNIPKSKSITSEVERPFEIYMYLKLFKPADFWSQTFNNSNKCVPTIVQKF